MNYLREADRLFSLLIRQDAMDENGCVVCVTCGRIYFWKRVHLGHFMVRQHQATRFDRQNTGCQCVKCNTFEEGRQYDFAKYLDKKYGEGTAEKMRIKSKMYGNRNRASLRYMIQEFKNELKEKGYKAR